MNRDVFISHASADADVAQAIRAACEDAGLACWIAPRDIQPGASWADAIASGLGEAAMVLLVHSAASNASEMVRREINLAATGGKPILPVRIDLTQPDQGMQFYLGNTQWFDAPPPLAPHLPRLIDTLRMLRSRPTGRVPHFPEFGYRPAIAVLPFRSQSPGAEILAEGLADELINALSAWRSFPVIARNSTFAIGAQAGSARAIGQRLGARYIVSGGLRRDEGALRVSLALADAETEETLLAETNSYRTADPLAMQDAIVLAIAGILAPEVLKLERARAAQLPLGNGSLYDLHVRGMWHRYRNTREDVAEAEALFRQALAIDPGFGRAMTGLCACRNYAAINRWTPDPPAALAEALHLAQGAVAADPRDPHAWFHLGVGLTNCGRGAEGTAALREAIRLNPSHAHARANLGQALNFRNLPDQAMVEIDLSLRLNPHDPLRFMWLPYLAASHYLGGRYRACLRAAGQALEAKPDYPLAARYMVAALGQLGLSQDAQRLFPLLRRSDTDFAGIAALWRRLFDREAADHLLAGISRAGFV